MVYAAPKYGLLGSCKVTLKGSRWLIALPFSQALSVCSQMTGVPAEKLSIEDVGDFISVADAGTCVVLKAESKIMSRLIVPGDMFILPWGWFVIEKSVNGCDNIGLRYLFADEKPSVDIIQMAEKVCPGVDTLLKANTAIGLLLRLLRAAITDDMAPPDKAGHFTAAVPTTLDGCDKLKAKFERPCAGMVGSAKRPMVAAKTEDTSPTKKALRVENGEKDKPAAKAKTT